VAGCCEHGEEPLGSGAMEVVFRFYHTLSFVYSLKYCEVEELRAAETFLHTVP
jgi:hypothetical protein